jgi:hypothetical protein
MPADLELRRAGVDDAAAIRAQTHAACASPASLIARPGLSSAA